MIVTIELTETQYKEAMIVARARQDMNVARGIKDKHGASEGIALHEPGALGERALAAFLQIPWTGNLGDFGAADVGELQVRTRSQRHHRLILHPDDKPNDIFVLATIVGPRTVELTGWMYARMGKQDVYWKDPGTGRPAYFVPPDLLYDMDDLVEMIEPFAARSP